MPARLAHRSAYAAAQRSPYWFDDPARPERLPALRAPAAADLVVVGGGYLGLWTALLARRRDPACEVLVVEAAECGHAASGRNGGFCEASLTHGFGNGVARWPEEMPTLLRLGRENLQAIAGTVEELDIDCDWTPSGSLAVATTEHQVDELRGEHAQLRRHGVQASWLEGADLTQRIRSPRFLGAVHDPDSAMVEPARLAWGLRDACRRVGVRIVEGTEATGLERSGAGVRVHTSGGPGATVTAGRAVLATNAFPSLLRRLRLMTVPVYDYALMTEPLTAEQRTDIGWHGREGLSDAGNQFVYSRTTRDGRILWGGYDAVYHYGSRIRPDLEDRERTFDVLADGFFRTFPQLEGLRFTHAWGGVIDTCTRFTAFYGTAMDRRVGYALGFTGLGVAATRFAAEVVLDLLDRADTERTRLQMVRRKPVPFPPEPLRWAGIQATRWSLARADDHGGRPNLWLRTMDRLGLGFDS